MPKTPSVKMPKVEKPSPTAATAKLGKALSRSTSKLGEIATSGKPRGFIWK